MNRFIFRRLLKGLATVWFIWTLIFVLVRLSGDPVDWMIPDTSNESVKQELRISLGLDYPIWKQYFISFRNIFKGEMGTSYYYKRSVVALFNERLLATYSIALPSLALAGVFGVLAGVLSAIKHDTVLDRILMSLAIIFYTIPGFAFAILLIIVFALELHVLPSGGMGTWKNMVLPIVCLTAGPMATVARLTRSAMLDVLGKEFLDGARMKGISEKVVIIKHALRNSLIPVVTTLGMQLGTIIGGAVVVETVFGWPGIGSLLVTGAQQRDFPIVQYGILLLAIVVTIVNILVDISYGWLDPRIRDSMQ